MMKILLNTTLFISAAVLSFASSALTIKNLSDSTKEVYLDIEKYDEAALPYNQRASILYVEADGDNTYPIEIPLDNDVVNMALSIYGEDFSHKITPHGCEITINGNKDVEYTTPCGIQ